MVLTCHSDWFKITCLLSCCQCTMWKSPALHLSPVAGHWAIERNCHTLSRTVSHWPQKCLLAIWSVLCFDTQTGVYCMWLCMMLFRTWNIIIFPAAKQVDEWARWLLCTPLLLLLVIILAVLDRGLAPSKLCQLHMLPVVLQGAVTVFWPQHTMTCRYVYNLLATYTQLVQSCYCVMPFWADNKHCTYLLQAAVAFHNY